MFISISDNGNAFTFNTDHLILIERDINNSKQTILWFAGIGLHSKRTVNLPIGHFKLCLSAALRLREFHRYEEEEIQEIQSTGNVYVTRLA